MLIVHHGIERFRKIRDQGWVEVEVLLIGPNHEFEGCLFEGAVS